MTLLDERDVTGLTTTRREVEVYPWPASVGITTSAWPPSRYAASPSQVVLGGPAGSASWLSSHVHDLEQKINKLLALPYGWDHRQAKQTSQAAVVSAVRVLLSLITTRSLPVQLFPLPDGGIQAEWHVAGSSIEIEFDGKGDVFVIAERSDGTTLIENELDADSGSEVLEKARLFLASLSR